MRKDHVCPVCDKYRQIYLEQQRKMEEKWETRDRVQATQASELRINVKEIKAMLQNMQDELYAVKDRRCCLHHRRDADRGGLPHCKLFVLHAHRPSDEKYAVVLKGSPQHQAITRRAAQETTKDRGTLFLHSRMYHSPWWCHNTYMTDLSSPMGPPGTV